MAVGMARSALLAAITGLWVLPAVAASPPNVLLIVSDDHQHSALGCAGNAIVKTPNLDKLAREGVRFTHAFVSIPICTPSRAAFLTGRFGAHSGVTFFNQKIREEVPTWPGVLGRQGYQTAFTGKWHNDGRPATRGFEWTANVFLGGMSDYLDPQLTQGAKGAPQKTRGNITELFTDAALCFLRERDAQRPFFLYVAYTAPHDPRTPPPEYERRYDPDRMPLPGNFMPVPPFDPGTLQIRDERLLPRPLDPAAIRRETARYYGQITHLDTQIGRLLEALQRQGLAGNTIVLFAGDNGLTLGAHGLLGKQTLYDEGVRVPLIIRHPGLNLHGRTRDALVYLFDLLPTVCAWTNCSAPAGLDGLSLDGVYRGAAPEVRDAVFGRYDDLFRSIRTQRYKLIQFLKLQREQLFDLQADPLELQDLASEPPMSQIRRQLHDRLMEWRHRCGDDDGARGPSRPETRAATGP